MAQTATTQGLTATWNSTPLGKVMDGSFDDNVVTVDCTCLDDDQVDNRAGTADPSGTVTISLKDSNTVSIAAGDVGVLGIGDLSGKVLVSGVSTGSGANSARTKTLTFVSTEETAGT